MVLIDREKAHDRVPNKTLKRKLMKRCLSKVYMNVIVDLYEEEYTKMNSLRILVLEKICINIRHLVLQCCS